MNNPSLSNYWKWNEKSYRFDIYFETDFSKLCGVKQVYTVGLNKEKDSVLLVLNRMGLWLLPGGEIEDGEKLVDTLIREVKEETNRDIDQDSIKPFFYQKVFKELKDKKWKYSHTEVRYIAIVSNDIEFERDPDNGDIIKTEWVPIEKLHDYLQWGETSKIMQERITNLVSDR